MGLAVLVLCDLALRARALTAHYTSDGVLPVWALHQWLGSSVRLLPHAYGGSALYQALLFLLTAACALALLLGWRTRFATFATWFLVASMQTRNPTINNSGDTLLRVMLFWGMLVPLAGRWSVDSAQKEGRPPDQVTTVATFAIQMQLCLMYWFTAILKWHPVWIEDLTALEVALNIDHLTTSLGRALLSSPELLGGLTAFTLGLEFLGPLLVWSPFWTGPLRFLVALTFILFHLVGLAPTLHLGLFPWVCAVAWLMFLPSWMWNRLEVERANVFAAVDRLFRRLAARLPSPRLQPSERSKQAAGWIVSTSAAVLLTSVVAWNVRTVKEDREGVRTLPETTTSSVVKRLLRATRLNQRWVMFAPHPPFDDGWYVMPGMTTDGREVDAWRDHPEGPFGGRPLGQPVDWTKPRDVNATTGSNRWDKYLANLSQDEYRYHRPLFSKWLCHSWNREHRDGDRLAEFSMVFMLERFAEPQAPPQPLALAKHECEPAP